MFGVLVVENGVGELGYISAYSGKVEGAIVTTGLFLRYLICWMRTVFIEGEKKKSMTSIAASFPWKTRKNFFRFCQRMSATRRKQKYFLRTWKADIKAKEHRKALRTKAEQTLTAEDASKVIESLNTESAIHHFEWKDASRHWRNRLEESRQGVEVHQKL